MKREAVIKKVRKALCIVLVVVLVLVAVFFLLRAVGFLRQKGEGAVVARVSSYDELKEALINSHDVLLPDLSRYADGEDRLIYVYNKRWEPKNKDGYSISFGVDKLYSGKYNLIGGDSVFVELGVSCYRLEVLPYPNVREPIPTNWRHRGVLFEKSVEEASQIILGNYGTNNEYQRFPLGSKANTLGFGFDYGGCRYRVGGCILTLPGEVNTMDARCEAAEAELLAIVDDILDKGGVPR